LSSTRPPNPSKGPGTNTSIERKIGQQKKIREEEENQIAQEIKRREQLGLDTENWHKAQRISAYIDAVKKSHPACKSNEIEGWIN
jgi:hypothetical protein